MNTDIYKKLIQPSVEATIDKLVSKRFVDDPLIPGEYSRIASIVSSAYKRHGFILEQAILIRLKNIKYLQVWDDPNFGVSASAESLVATFIDREGDAVMSELPYLDSVTDQVRHIQVDAIVYNKNTKALTSYEIKRGNGLHDAGKRRSMKRDLLIQQTLLKSYGTQKGLDVQSVDSKIIFYYGQCSLPKPFAITGSELNEHFGVKIQEYVEIANNLFAEKLQLQIETLLKGKFSDPLNTATVSEKVIGSEKEQQLNNKSFLSKIFGG